MGRYLSKRLKLMIKNSEIGLVIDFKKHKDKKWTSALSSYLIEELIKKFDPHIITNQFDYFRKKNKLRYIISLEPGWAAPKIDYDVTRTCIKAVFYSDPHYQTKRRFDYFSNNEFDFVFSYYYSPFFFHFENFPEEKFVHLPWAIPEQFVNKSALNLKNTDIVIFGAQNNDAYDVRNWCRMQEGVKNFSNSGVENKIMTDEEYFKWLAQFDAIVAAGSSRPEFDLVTPKYFEIAASGSLLIGQECKDLEKLGFNDKNALIFNKNNFNDKLKLYRSDPEKFLKMRFNGRELIKSKHLLSHRIETIKKTLKIE